MAVRNIAPEGLLTTITNVNTIMNDIEKLLDGHYDRLQKVMPDWVQYVEMSIHYDDDNLRQEVCTINGKPIGGDIDTVVVERMNNVLTDIDGRLISMYAAAKGITLKVDVPMASVDNPNFVAED